MAGLQETMEAEPPTFPPPAPARMTKAIATTATKANPIIELGDQTGDDCTILNKANQKTANNLTYHGIMRSMVS